MVGNADAYSQRTRMECELSRSRFQGKIWRLAWTTRRNDRAGSAITGSQIMGALAHHRLCEKASRMKRKTILPNFVALFDETIDAPAWRALTPIARLLYVALKRKLNYEKNNNGKIYLAHRSAAHELGSDKAHIA